jgi:uracil-DNA glycosylase family 4
MYSVGEGIPSARPFAAFRSEADTLAIAEKLEPVRTIALACTACALAEGRTNVVFGAGSARSGIVIIGEAPGATEDATGLPFVGRSGKLLTEMLASVGLAREDVFIANVLKCRPPQNRAPKPLEARTCAPLLAAQLAALEARVIFALGLSAARWLIPGKAPMSALRGESFTYLGTPTLVTFHPAAILRNPNRKGDALEDFARLRKLAEA